jgi:hypothetical protein
MRIAWAECVQFGNEQMGEKRGAGAYEQRRERAAKVEVATRRIGRAEQAPPLQNLDRIDRADMGCSRLRPYTYIS